jgi:type II secretory pathway component PulF
MVLNSNKRDKLMKQISTSNRYALLLTFFFLIVCTVLHSLVIEAQQKMYFTDGGTLPLSLIVLDIQTLHQLYQIGTVYPCFAACALGGKVDKLLPIVSTLCPNS